MKIELKNIKVSERLSDETTCFSATIYIDGKRAGEVVNRGCGGPNEYAFPDRELHKQFDAFCESLPPTEEYALPMDADLYLDNLLYAWQDKQLLKRQCKKTTLFRLKGELYKKDEWQTVKSAYNVKVKEYLDKKYGSRLGEILNESIGA